MPANAPAGVGVQVDAHKPHRLEYKACTAERPLKVRVHINSLFDTAKQ